MINENIKSPFKFLDPFNKNEIDSFFGREKETKQLYEFVNKNRVVLVYGQSGTGKTSIIQCGLANEFDVTEWNPFFIRRHDNINESLSTALNDEHIAQPSVSEIKGLADMLFNTVVTKDDNTGNMNDDDSDEKKIAKQVYKLQKITEYYLRPIYLVFDQFEELLILGGDVEKKLFIKTLQSLLNPNSTVDCHIIIIMREEYFAWLDRFENDIPGLSDRRLRIEIMRTKEIKTVIVDSCGQFNIELEDPDSNADKIIEAIADHGEVSLPYLQVYLDQLWRKDYKKTYPEGYTGKDKFAALTFTAAEIIEFGEIKDVLQRFLIEQRFLLQDSVMKKYPDAPKKYVPMLLDCFVNDRGSKMPNSYEVQNGFYVFKKKAAKFLRDTDQKLLKFSLDFLQNSQILRNDGSTFELAHDILAKLIESQRDAKQKKLNGIKQMVSMYKKMNELIPFDAVRKWNSYIGQLSLKDSDREFFDRSKEEGEKIETRKLYEGELQKAIEKKEIENRISLERKEAENKLQLKKKEADNKLALEKRKARTNKRLGIFAFFLILFLAISYWKSIKREDQYVAMDIISGLDTMSEKNYADALSYAKYVYDFQEYDNSKKDKIISSIKSIASEPSFAKKFAAYNYTLNSSTALVTGLEIDISGNGEFICFRNDLVRGQNSQTLYYVANVKTHQILDTLKKVNYAYFLNRSDTLLLSYTTAAVTNDYPDKFILYSCKERKVIGDTIRLNPERTNVRRFLYRKDFLDNYSFSEWDSYNIRRMSSGKLIIPYFVTGNNGLIDQEPGAMIYDLRTKNEEILSPNMSNFSISISKDASKLLYVNQGTDYTCEVYRSDGSRFSPARNIRWGDFTVNGTIAYTKGNEIIFCNDEGAVLKRDTSKIPMVKLFTGVNEDYTIGIDKNTNLHLVNFKKPYDSFKIKETLIGYNFNKKTFITQEGVHNNFEGDTINLRLRYFDKPGQTANNHFSNKYGIESFEFNSSTNCILLKTRKLPKSNLQLLYLLDDTLGLRAAFYLTPNDSYGFSKDGMSFFFVRDNELSVFENKKFPDLSNFDSINEWLENEKSADKYMAHIQALRAKYDIQKFPSQRLFFWDR